MTLHGTVKGLYELLLPCLFSLSMLCHWYKNYRKFQETWCWSFFGCYMMWVAWVTSCDSSPVGWVFTHEMRAWFKPAKNLTWKNVLCVSNHAVQEPNCIAGVLQLHCRVLLCVWNDIKYILKWFDIVYEYMWYYDICVSDIRFNLTIRYIFLLYDSVILLHI